MTVIQVVGCGAEGAPDAAPGEMPVHATTRSSVLDAIGIGSSHVPRDQSARPRECRYSLFGYHVGDDRSSRPVAIVPAASMLSLLFSLSLFLLLSSSSSSLSIRSPLKMRFAVAGKGGCM